MLSRLAYAMASCSQRHAADGARRTCVQVERVGPTSSFSHGDIVVNSMRAWHEEHWASAGHRRTSSARRM